MPAIPEEVVLHTPLTYDFSATDDISGVAFLRGFLDGDEISQGAVVPAMPVGGYIFEAKTSDRASNPRSSDIRYDVVYQFGGFLPPLEGGGIYKKNRTIPVKFRLADYNGEFITSALAHLYTAKIENGIIREELSAISSSKANDGNRFRYDDEEDQYIFNLSTKDMESGEWRLRVELDDWRNYTIVISIQ